MCNIGCTEWQFRPCGEGARGAVLASGGGGVVKSIKSMPNLDPRSSRCDSLSTLLRMTRPHSRACRFGKMGNAMKTFFSSLLIVFATLFAAPAYADEPTNTCPNGQILHQYESAVGTVSQNGTPTPENPIEPVFYTQGDMVLRKVGDYADSYDATTGKITRRVGVKVLNGTENWTIITTPNYLMDGATTFWNVGAIQDNLSVRSDGPAIGISNYLINAPVSSANMTPKIANSFSIGSTAHSNHTLWMRIEGEKTVAEWKQYLAQQYADGTPVVVYYPLAEAVEETVGTTYCADTIKIATTAYNSARFSPVVTDLNSAVATIREIVTNTINQTAAIASLQADKQTRPEDACPAGKKCLLVETEENGVVVPHWFPIIEAPEE